MKYRGNQLSALLDNFDMYTKVLDDYKNASGSAADEAQKTADSIEGRLNQLSNTWNRTVANVVDSDLIKGLTSTSTNVIDLVDKLNLLQTALIALGGFGTFKFFTGFIPMIKNAITSTIAFGNALNAVKTKGFVADATNLSNAIKGLTLSQASAVLSTKTLSKEIIYATLTQAGFSKQEATTTASTLTMASAQGVATTSTIGLGASIKALGAAMAANPIGLIITGITIAISALSFGLSKAKQAQEEYIQTTKQHAEESKTLTSNISNLVNKYNELSKEVKTNASVKDDLITTQNELLTKLGLEGQSVEDLTKKYGGLTEAIRQATLSQLQDSERSLKAQYSNEKENLIDVGGSGSSSLIFSSKKNYDALMKLLTDAGLNVVKGENKNTGYFNLEGDEKTSKGVLKNFKDIKTAMDTISNSGLYKTDQLQNLDLYTKLQDKYTELKPAVDSYNSSITDLNTNLAQQQTLTLLQGQQLPKTQEEFDSFKQSLVDSAIASGKFIGSQKKIKASIDNYLATQPEFIGFFDTVVESTDKATVAQQGFTEAQNKAIDEYQKSISSIGKALSDLDKLSPTDIIDLMQQFPELAEYGFTGSEGIDALKLALEKVGTQLYNNLDPSIENVELFKQMYKEAMDASNSILSFSDALSKMNDSGKFLEDVKKEFKELDYISSETLNKIASKYPELESIISQYTSGILKDASFIVDELEKAYDIDFENYRTATIEKIGQNEEFFESIISNLPDWVKELADSYDIDYTNWKNLNSAKLEIYEEFKKKQARLDVMNNIFNQKGANGTISMFDVAEIQRMRKEVDEYEKIYNEVINSIGNNLDLKGYTPSKIGSGSGKEKDYIKEAFDLGTTDKKGNKITGKNDLDHQLAMEEITQKQYLDGLEKINKATYGKNKKTHLENYRQYLEEVKKGRDQIDKKLAEDKIKSKFNDLEYEHEMGLKTDDKYWKIKLKYAEKYYKKNGEIIDEYLDEYRSIQSGYYKWTQQQAEESAKKQEKIAENLKDKYTDLIGEIADEVKKEKDDVLNGLEESHKNTIKNLEEQKDNYKEIINAQIDILDAKKKQNDYEKSIANKTKEISKIESRKAELEKAAQSGDRTAIAELAKLNEDLSKKKEDLSDEQSDHELDLQKESLNNALDLNDKLMDARIDAENTRFETQKSNIEKLYDKEIELISKAAQYTKDEFGRALDEIATQLASSGIVQSSNSLGSVKQAQGGIADSIINASTSNRSAILAILSNGTGKDYGEDASALASYTRDNYGAPISKKQAVEVAKMLGVSGINSVSDLTGNDENKNKILEALRKAGFSKGGYVDASLIKKTNDDGLALVKHGEAILTVEQGKLFKELVNNIKPLNNLVKLSTPNISNITNKTNSPNINIPITIQGNATPSTVSALNNAGNNIVKQIMDEVRKL